ncbi:MAG: DsbA family protein [Alphaproteobacteria bacterium]|nr:DsbA family protein [Alphaproteobacteria bacterium]
MFSRSFIFVAALVLAVGTTMGYGIFSATAPTGLSAGDVRAIVQDVLDERPEAPAAGPVASVDPGTINPMIETYLMDDPRILERLSIALQTELDNEARAEVKVALAALSDVLYSDPQHPVLGNPEGDVTIVELFDYNCPYCARSMPELMQMIDEDPDLRVILKEFPVLGPGSTEAARISVAVLEAGADYDDFHQRLFAVRGGADGASAMRIVSDMGLNAVEIELQSASQTTTDVIQRSFDIAQALQISGTPAFIIGDEIVMGAVGIDVLRQKVASVRECGSTICN